MCHSARVLRLSAKSMNILKSLTVIGVSPFRVLDMGTLALVVECQLFIARFRCKHFNLKYWILDRLH